MTDNEIELECERRFQNGESRTHVFNSEGEHVGQLSSARQSACVNQGDRVFARRKANKGTYYYWAEIK